MQIAHSSVIDDFKHLIKTDYSLPLMIMSSLVFLVSMAVFHANPVVIYSLGLIMFGSYDRLSFYHMLEMRNGVPRTAYRVVQHIFLALIGVMMFSASPLATICFLASWLMGVSDMLYYIVGKEWKFVKFADMYWLWWCPWAILGVPKTGRNLVVFSVLTYVASIIVLTVFHQ